MAYTIKKGDTLSALARQYGTTVAHLVSINKIKDPNKIRAGARITIPGTSLVGQNPKPPVKPPAEAPPKTPKSGVSSGPGPITPIPAPLPGKTPGGYTPMPPMAGGPLSPRVSSTKPRPTLPKSTGPKRPTIARMPDKGSGGGRSKRSVSRVTLG